MKFVLDNSKAQTLQLSNDAFFYLLNEEEPLDSDNLKEAEQVFSLFPNGYIIGDDWQYLPNGKVSCIFTPYVEDTIDYDAYEKLTNDLQAQIKWLDKDTIDLWWYNTQTGSRLYKGTFKVYTNEYGLRYFKTDSISTSFIKHFTKKA